MKDEDQARADSAQQAGDEGQDVESTPTNQDGSDFDGGISKEEQELLDSIKDPGDFMNAADQVGPEPKNSKEPQDEDDSDTTEDESEETDDADDSQEESDDESGEETEETEDPDDESGEDSTEEEESEEEESEDNEDAEEEKAPQFRKESTKRFRLRSDNPVDQRAFELKRRNADLSLEECLERAKKEFGKDKQGDDADGQEQSGQPQTVSEVDAKIKELKAEKKKAYTEDLDFDKVADLEDQLDDLLVLRSDLKASEGVTQQREQQEFERQVEASKARAVELYPFAADPNSPEVDRMNEIFETMRETNDDRLYDPNLPLMLAQMVAREQGIAPKGRKAVPAKKAKPNDGKPPKKKGLVQPSRGNARTTPKSTSEQLDKTIDNISSPHDWEALIGQA